MLDSNLLGNAEKRIDIQLPKETPPSASSLLGNDQNVIDVALPASRTTVQEHPTKKQTRRVHREAVAAERARRRAAAAREREETARQREQRRRESEVEAVSVETSVPAVELPVSAPSDPLERVRAAEEARILEKKRLARRDAMQKEAAQQYRAATHAAKRTCKKLRRQSDRAFRREASAERAKAQQTRAERIMGGVNIGVCMGLVATIALGMVVLERPTVSEIENRNLAELPTFSFASYFSGAYTEGVANWYNDTVPMRSLFKNLTAQIRQYMGWQGDDVAFHGGAPVVPKEPEATEPAVTTTDASDPEIVVTTTHTTAATTAQETTEPPEEEGGELSNNILIWNKRAISLYGGSHKVGERYASYLNAYKRDLGAQVNVYSMVVPTPCSFYTPEEYQSLIGSETGNIDHINAHLEQVTPIDVYRALLPHTEENIYMRTDHHWSSLGAFYAAEEFSAVARVPFAPITEYDRVGREGYVGTMYGYSGDITLKNNPEEFFFYQPRAQFTTTYFNRSLGAERNGNLLMNIDSLGKPINWYLVYLGGDDRVTHVHTEVGNGRTLAVFKDSYGNALIPWLTSSFSDIYVIDIRFFTPNAISYLREVGATDVLFAMNTFSATGGNAKEIEKIRTQ